MNKYYVYESCGTLNSFSIKNSQVIQTLQVSGVSLPNEIFKDNNGLCWTYVGSFDESYLPPFTVFPIKYSGDYFSNVVNIKYPTCLDCQLTTVTSCTETIFSATRCDNSETVYVKVCNVGPTVGTLKLLPTTGQIVGVKNPTGDDFCVTLVSETTSQTTNYEIVTPAWENYNCTTCPLYKEYTADACDGSVTGVTLYSLSSSTTLEVGNSVRINNDDLCYEITSYNGLVVEYNAINAESNFIINAYTDCESCLINLYSR